MQTVQATHRQERALLTSCHVGPLRPRNRITLFLKPLLLSHNLTQTGREQNAWYYASGASEEAYSTVTGPSMRVRYFELHSLRLLQIHCITESVHSVHRCRSIIIECGLLLADALFLPARALCAGVLAFSNDLRALARQVKSRWWLRKLVVCVPPTCIRLPH